MPRGVYKRKPKVGRPKIQASVIGSKVGAGIVAKAISKANAETNGHKSLYFGLILTDEDDGPEVTDYLRSAEAAKKEVLEMLDNDASGSNLPEDGLILVLQKSPNDRIEIVEQGYFVHRIEWSTVNG